jgi:hypothetical protein
MDVIGNTSFAVHNNADGNCHELLSLAAPGSILHRLLVQAGEAGHGSWQLTPELRKAFF